MLYYLAYYLTSYVDFLNVLTYQTVRAGAAAFTGFALCLIFGPKVIAHLRALKIGQYIKKDHVADLHELHKSKAGTPTMGGIMIIGSTLIALLLWGRLGNPLLWTSMLVFLLLGGVGFVDDYIKLVRKHNDGLSARAKFSGQILTGLLLGLFLYYNPITVSATWVYPRDITDWAGVQKALSEAAKVPGTTAHKKIWGFLPDDVKAVLEDLDVGGVTDEGDRATVVRGLNAALRQRGLYESSLWPDAALNPEITTLLQQGVGLLDERDLIRLNRLLLEDCMPRAIADSQPNLHTKVGVPGFKNLFIPLGFLYVFFVVLVIVSMSNAVNLTDGLDGLATGVSVISIITYAGIAYVVSRSDWSRYLFLTYVPDASELFVFGGALLGAGLGFLWFNAHPAEVFMGDTGSLALGGAIGSMALLTKQELLLPVVAGMFVLEAASVVIQVVSFKTTGKRVFRMAPLHHHFELLGWKETKVTMRFYILALFFALMSLGALKLR